MWDELTLFWNELTLLLNDLTVGANFSLYFHFSLTCHRVLLFFFLLFALRYFVNYAPLLRAVCKFGYSLLSPTTNTSYPQHLVSGLIFIVFFNFVL